MRENFGASPGYALRTGSNEDSKAAILLHQSLFAAWMNNRFDEMGAFTGTPGVRAYLDVAFR
jgi:hypothetical protein